MRNFYRKNNVVPLFSFLLLACAAFFYSCSMISSDEAADSSASISFKITDNFVKTIRGGVTSRAASVPESEANSKEAELDTKNLYLEILILGSYTATKTVSFSEETKVKFSGIPIGSQVYAEARIYIKESEESSVLIEETSEENASTENSTETENSSEQTSGGDSAKEIVIYTGKSETITIQEGENRLPLTLKKVEAEKYTITVSGEIENGTVTVSKEKAEAGETITITATPDDGWEINSLTVTDSDGNEIELDSDGTFTMPESEVTITAEFVEEPITLATALKNGAEIVCAYNQTKWGDTSTETITFKYESGSYTKTAGSSSFSNATLTFDEAENTLTLYFTDDVYIDTTIFYINTSKYKYQREQDTSNTGATSGAKVSFKSITINGENITSSLTQGS